MELELAVHSTRLRVMLRDDDAAIDALAAFLGDLSASLALRGCTLVGHIKGMAGAGEVDPLFFSLTHLQGSPQFRGGRLEGVRDFELTLSMILAGLESDRMSEATQEALAAHFEIIPLEATK